MELFLNPLCCLNNRGLYTVMWNFSSLIFRKINAFAPSKPWKFMRRRLNLFVKTVGIIAYFAPSLGSMHKPVCSSTIARWLKSCLQKAGVDVTVFSFPFYPGSFCYEGSNGRSHSWTDNVICWLVKPRNFSEVLLQAFVFSSLWEDCFGGQWMCFKITCWYGDRAFRSIIFEWLRSCNGHLLFVIIRGRWGWHINISLPPFLWLSLLPFLIVFTQVCCWIECWGKGKKPKCEHGSCIYRQCHVFLVILRISCIVFQILAVCNWELANYMLICQPHLPRIITNSRQPLHDLSHSKIIPTPEISQLF